MAATDIDRYLAALDEPARGTLEEMRRRILEVVPEADQGISYSHPAFTVEGKVVAGFGAFKKHLSYLPHSGSVLTALHDEVAEYEQTKGSLHFPLATPLPRPLIKRLVMTKTSQLGLVMPREPIFHLTEAPVWAQALAVGSLTESTRGSSLDDVGFVHCSYRHQVETVAGFVYADGIDDLLLLEIDPALVPSEIRVDSTGEGRDAYPHIYGPIPVTAVTAIHAMTRSEGQWQLPRR